ncbi:YajG family lipoprotein [Shewanella sp. AS1]|uniref:YajG family lipoprotein n=1 Tax=Shewanella sp. AS1 TaxID=2907626 RepID=UPI001F346417|nr:YajG family lipoprotein [Shewanella sp. AS1]MCE9677957.1 YajG family lipoprotein [Shewanella sp. AS1]
MKAIIVFFVGALLLTGCATHAPTHMALNPQTPAITSPVLKVSPLAVEMIDTRSANFVARFNRGDDAAQLVSPSEAPRQQLDQVFRLGFTKAGYTIDPSSVQHVEIQLEKLLTDVNESFFGYEATNDIVINVIASNTLKTFTKRYTGHNKVSGPLSPDFATLELAMNVLLDQLTSKIINDPELNQFIQE